MHGWLIKNTHCCSSLAGLTALLTGTLMRFDIPELAVRTCVPPKCQSNVLFALLAWTAYMPDSMMQSTLWRLKAPECT